MVAGQTGAGKTTLVDSFLNYLLGTEYYDKFRYKLVDEKKLVDDRTANTDAADESEKDKAKAAQVTSMTSAVTIYHIPHDDIVNNLSEEKQTCINLIDTPGFGDTRGPAWD